VLNSQKKEDKQGNRDSRVYCSVPVITMSKLKFVIPLMLEDTERVRVADNTEPELPCML
jgi:hypothetical protein